jgi:hypothetical protein
LTHTVYYIFVAQSTRVIEGKETVEEMNQRSEVRGQKTEGGRQKAGGRFGDRDLDD